MLDRPRRRPTPDNNGARIGQRPSPCGQGHRRGASVAAGQGRRSRRDRRPGRGVKYAGFSDPEGNSWTLQEDALAPRGSVVELVPMHPVDPRLPPDVRFVVVERLAINAWATCGAEARGTQDVGIDIRHGVDRVAASLAAIPGRLCSGGLPGHSAVRPGRCAPLRSRAPLARTRSSEWRPRRLAAESRGGGLCAAGVPVVAWRVPSSIRAGRDRERGLPSG
jgi:hypothetical protein